MNFFQKRPVNLVQITLKKIKIQRLLKASSTCGNHYGWRTRSSHFDKTLVTSLNKAVSQEGKEGQRERTQV
jgi:hypothetical protein